MGNYISTNDVQIRLVGKVEFTTDQTDGNKMQITLLNRLISEAEGQVEYDLSPRYSAPFQTAAGGPFRTLTDRPTNDIIRTLCELQAVMRVLETDFGRGSVVNSENYSERLEKRYAKMVGQLLKKKGKDDEQAGWYYPPLPNLLRSYFNTEADDGFGGQVLSTSSGLGAFPLERINDPAENFFNTSPDTFNPAGPLTGGDIPGGNQGGE